jgi:hypothetical protein
MKNRKPSFTTEGVNREELTGQAKRDDLALRRGESGYVKLRKLRMIIVIL